MKIALLGAGFASLATTWQLLHYAGIEVTVFDPRGIGGGASGLSVALLHPFAGPHSKINSAGWEGFQATQELLCVASCYNAPVFKETGILRPAITPLQLNKFAIAAKQHTQDILWLEAEEMQARVPGIAGAPGIFIPQGTLVYGKNYLRGLWSACQKKGAKLQQVAICCLAELDHFDAVIVAAGSAIKSIQEASALSLSLVKGQQLELEWPKDYPPLACPINSQLYCLMDSQNQSCHIGSTFERHFTTPEPDLQTAKAELLPKLKELYPPLQNAKIIGCHAAVRVSTPNRQPLIQKIGPKTWVFTGLASKGLLYHALYGQRLAEEVVQQTLSNLKKK